MMAFPILQIDKYNTKKEKDLKKMANYSSAGKEAGDSDPRPESNTNCSPNIFPYSRPQVPMGKITWNK
jgi:hypothetical protein